MADSEYINGLPEHLRALGQQILDYYDGAGLPDSERESNGGPGRPTGGNLHIVLDDGNWRREDIEFCRRQASAANDAPGVAIADALLTLPDEDRERL